MSEWVGDWNISSNISSKHDFELVAAPGGPREFGIFDDLFQVRLTACSGFKLLLKTNYHETLTKRRQLRNIYTFSHFALLLKRLTFRIVQANKGNAI